MSGKVTVGVGKLYKGWKGYSRGVKVTQRCESTSRAGNVTQMISRGAKVIQGVGRLHLRWEGYCRGRNLTVNVGMLQ